MPGEAILSILGCHKTLLIKICKIIKIKIILKLQSLLLYWNRYPLKILNDVIIKNDQFLLKVSVAVSWPVE